MASLGRGLGGFVDFFDSAFPVLDQIQGATNDACAAFSTADLSNTDANIIDVRDNWQTTGFYTPEQMMQIISFATALKNHAAMALTTAQNVSQLDQHRELLDKAQAGLVASLVSPAPFLAGVNDAQAQGIEIIESQGFKRWIINNLRAARNAEYTTKVVGCARPSFVFGALQALNNAVSALVDFVKTIGRVIVKIGQTVLKIPDIISSMITFVKILGVCAIAFGGYYAGVKTGVIPTRFDPMRLRERETFKPWRRQ